MAAGLYALRGVEVTHELTGTVGNMDHRSSDLISDYKPSPLPFVL